MFCDFSTVGRRRSLRTSLEGQPWFRQTGLNLSIHVCEKRATFIDPQVWRIGRSAFRRIQAEHVARSSGFSPRPAGSLAGLERTSSIAKRELRPGALRDVPIHPCLTYTFFVARHCVRRHRNNRNMSPTFQLARANRGGRLQTIHFGHLNVHQTRSGSLFAQGFEGLPAVSAIATSGPLFSTIGGHGLVHAIIFDQ